MAHVRAAAVDRGLQCLQQQLSGVLGGQEQLPLPASSLLGRKRARKVRTPESLSPSPVPCVQHPHRSPFHRDPPGPATGLPASSPGRGLWEESSSPAGPEGEGGILLLLSLLPLSSDAGACCCPPAEVQRGAGWRGSCYEMECHGPSAAPSGRSALELEDRTERVPLSSPALCGDPEQSLSLWMQQGHSSATSSRRVWAPLAGYKAPLHPVPHSESRPVTQAGKSDPLKSLMWQSLRATAGAGQRCFQEPWRAECRVQGTPTQQESLTESGEVTSTDADE